MSYLDDLLKEQRLGLLTLTDVTNYQISELYKAVVYSYALKLAKDKYDSIKKIDIDIEKVKNGLNVETNNIITKSISEAVGIGSQSHTELIKYIILQSNTKKIESKIITNSIVKANKKAIESIVDRKGFNLSTNIWEKSDKAMNHVKDIVKAGIEQKQSNVRIARALEKYVQSGKKTFTEDYPDMMARVGYIPKDLNYEALRTARTETIRAYSQGNRNGANENPFVAGMKYMLSPSHPAKDICDPITEQDLYGLGPGCYPMDKLPDYPFHPSCMCIELTLFSSDVGYGTDDSSILDELVNRLKEWDNNPSSQPEIEKWYQEEYKPNK